MNKNLTLDYISLGTRIRTVRKERNMTQAELGEACSLSTSYIGHIERGSRTLSLETLFKIATVLNTSMDYLVLDSMPGTQALFTSIESDLNRHDKRKTATFMRLLKILADNIDNL